MRIFPVMSLKSLWAIACLVLAATSGSVCAQTYAALGSGDYQLDSGDRIQIRVYGEEDLSMETLLSDSGVINYPFLGEIKVAGISPSQLEKKLVSGLKGDYLINPNIEVSIVEYRPFFINGEVNTPGGYAFQPGLTINRAVAIAQGMTPRASDQKIFIERGYGEAKKRFKADLDTRLYPGDIITIEQGIF